MSEYYDAVGAYYDRMVDDFEERYWANVTAQQIRQGFREEVKRHPFRAAFEVGCGNGIDLTHFGRIFPERSFVGVDVSPRMVASARGRIRSVGLKNARVEMVGVEASAEVLKPGAFELGYVFFGALNTVENLDDVADLMYTALAPGGHLVLTFVNRWYFADIVIGLLKGRWRKAFSRLRRTWGGYGLDQLLTSRCLGPRQVDGAFGRGGELTRRRGFSIAYPAWYRTRLLRILGRLGPRLWELDLLLNRTPAWAWGEYALYVYRKKVSPAGGLTSTEAGSRGAR